MKGKYQCRDYGAPDDDLSMNIGIGFERISALVHSIGQLAGYSGNSEIAERYRNEASVDIALIVKILDEEIEGLNRFIYDALDDSDVLGKCLNELKRGGHV
jgi:hypothetical protein